VTDGKNRAIPGLYACGEIVGGFHEIDFMTGTDLGQAATFGLGAARGIAEAI
jgi:anaerobic glycerol-3-phosphate dehydrogenase